MQPGYLLCAPALPGQSFWGNRLYSPAQFLGLHFKSPAYLANGTDVGVFDLAAFYERKGRRANTRFLRELDLRQGSLFPQLGYPLAYVHHSRHYHPFLLGASERIVTPIRL